MMVNDITGQSFTLILGKIKAIPLIQVIQLQPPGKDIFPLRNLFFYKLLYIMLILDITKDLLQYIFHGNNTGSTTKFIHHPGYTLTFLVELAQQIYRTHRL